ncbi:MAG: hypothetical protein GY721_12905 [Deltaproteobacteria bacterium]|nr:hypothetical protein [Deltaproteobacteria bacterium]
MVSESPERGGAGTDTRGEHPYEVTGYEIHMGETKLLDGVLPFSRIIERSGMRIQPGEGEGQDDGAVSRDGNIIGTYMHGIFDNYWFRLDIINTLRQRRGISAMSRSELTVADSEKEQQYRRLADLVRKHLDMDLIYKLIDTGSSTSGFPIKNNV